MTAPGLHSTQLAAHMVDVLTAKARFPPREVGTCCCQGSSPRGSAPALALASRLAGRQQLGWQQGSALLPSHSHPCPPPGAKDRERDLQQPAFHQSPAGSQKPGQGPARAGQQIPKGDGYQPAGLLPHLHQVWGPQPSGLLSPPHPTAISQVGAATLTALGTHRVAVIMWREMLSEPPAVEKVLQQLLPVLRNHSLHHTSPFIKDWPRVLALAVSSSLTPLSLSPHSPSLFSHRPAWGAGALPPPPFLHPYTSRDGMETCGTGQELYPGAFCRQQRSYRRYSSYLWS